MRALLALAIVATVGCKSPQEAILEAATGGQVDIKDGKVTVKGEDGEVTVVTDKKGGGQVTITNEKGEKAVISGDEGTMKIESKEGVAEFGTGKLPEGFPLPMIEGASVASSSKSSKGKGTVFHVVAEVDRKPGEVADFYAKALEENGFKKVKRTEHKAGATAMITLNARQKKRRAAVTVVREDEGKKTTMTIALSPR